MKKENITIEKAEAKCRAHARLRDKNEPCISCGEYKYKGNGLRDLDGGHYYAKKGYAGLRFDEMNVHGECAYCNRFSETHLIGYRENLIKKIGIEEVEALDKRAADYKKFGRKFSKSELLEIYNYYCEKIKQLKTSYEKQR